jgi:heme-binding protein
MPLPQTARRFGPLVACAIAGAAALGVLSGPAASAAPDPCAASEIARTIGYVAIDTGDYLDEHPQTNLALTAIAAQPAGPQSLTAVQTYFAANPRAALELQAIQQPLTRLSTRCELPVSLPQLLGLMQAAQGAQAAPGATAPQPVAAPTAPAQSLSGLDAGR